MNADSCIFFQSKKVELTKNRSNKKTPVENMFFLILIFKFKFFKTSTEQM